MSDILFERRGAAGLITLNRPQALNALTHAMVVAMKAQLDEWAGDPKSLAVVVRGAGERAFCAGGDIRAIAESGAGGNVLRARFLARRIHPERRDQALSQALRGADARHSDGRRGWDIGARTSIASPARLRWSPCRKPASDFFRTSAAAISCRAAPAKSACISRLTGARLKTADALYAGVATHLRSRRNQVADSDGRPGGRRACRQSFQRSKIPAGEPSPLGGTSRQDR
jgi:enoyl-CoA hydratase